MDFEFGTIDSLQAYQMVSRASTEKIIPDLREVDQQL